MQEDVAKIGLKQLLNNVESLLLCPGVTEQELQNQPEVLHEKWFRETYFEGKCYQSFAQNCHYLYYIYRLVKVPSWSG